MSLAEDLNPRAVIGDNKAPPLPEILADRYAVLLADAGKIADRAASLPTRVTDDIILGRVGDVVKDARKLSKALDAKRSEENEPFLTAQRETNAFFKVFMERLDRIGKDLEQRATEYNNAKAAEERRKLAEEARRAREEEERQREIAEAAAQKNRQGAAMRHEDRAEEEGARAARLESAARASAADLTRCRSDSGTVATTRTAWKGEVIDVGKVDLEKLRPYLPLEVIQKALNSAVRMGVRDCAGTRIFQDTKAAFR